MYLSYTKEIIEKLIPFQKVSYIFTLCIILIEIAIALSIFIPQYWKYVGYFSAFLLFFFAIVAIWGKMTGRITECPCFGRFFGGEIGFILIIRNLTLIILSIMMTKRLVSSNISSEY